VVIYGNEKIFIAADIAAPSKRSSQFGFCRQCLGMPLCFCRDAVTDNFVGVIPQAKSITEPFAYEEYRQKRIREKIDAKVASRVKTKVVNTLDGCTVH
jgi:hypothetical protein